MKKIILISILFVFNIFAFGQEENFLLGQKWKNYYFPYGNSAIYSLILYDNNYNYDILNIREDFFPWENGFYIWYFSEKKPLSQKITVSLCFLKDGETYFIIDEGYWDEDFYGYNFDKISEGSLSFVPMPALEYQKDPSGMKLKINMPEEGFYNYNGRKIIKGLVLLGAEEFKSYYFEDYDPVLYVPYYQEDTLEINIDSLPYPIITYTFLIDDNFSKNLENFPPLPLVSKPLILEQGNSKFIISVKTQLRKRQNIYLKAILENGFSNVEWKYAGELDGKKFILTGGFDGENYYPIAEINAEDFTYFDGEYFNYIFNHFIGERAAGIFYKIELRDLEDNLDGLSWTRSRQK